MQIITTHTNMYTELYDIFPNIQNEPNKVIENITSVFKKFLENFVTDLTVTYINLYFEVTFYGTLKELPREAYLNINNILYKIVIL